MANRALLQGIVSTAEKRPLASPLGELDGQVLAVEAAQVLAKEYSSIVTLEEIDYLDNADDLQRLRSRLTSVQEARARQPACGSAILSGVLLPATDFQERTWAFEKSIEGGTAQFNIASALTIRGSLDRDILRQATEELANRHSVLRTGFVEIDGVVSQVLTRPDVPLMFQHCPSRLDDDDLVQLALAVIALPLSMAEPPLWRIHVATIEDGQHLLTLVMHHAISDGWTKEMLLRELGALYTDCLHSSQLSDLKPAPQFFEYAIAQRASALVGHPIPAHEHWADIIEGASNPLASLRIQDPTGSARTARHLIERDRVFVAELKRTAQQSKTTPFIILLSAFFSALAHMTGQTDLTVRCPISNRRGHPTIDIAGPLSTSIIMRINLHQDSGMPRLIAATKDAVSRAMSAGPLSMRDLESEMYRRDKSMPRLETMMGFERLDRGGVTFGDSTGTRFEVPVSEARLDLYLHWVQCSTGLVGLFDTRCDAINAELTSQLILSVENSIDSFVLEA